MRSGSVSTIFCLVGTLFTSAHAKGLFTRCSRSSSGSLGSKSTAWDVVKFYLGENSATDLPLAGKVAVVTGGNSGIGCETTKALAAAGCKVYLATRSIEAGKQAISKEIVQLGKGGYALSEEAAASRIVVSQLDLEDLRSIRTFADEVLKEPRLDYLVLNAGGWDGGGLVTVGGWLAVAFDTTASLAFMPTSRFHAHFHYSDLDTFVLNHHCV